MGDLLECKNISVTFKSARGGTVQALEDLSLSVKKGSFVSLIGPSGCGKSTFLRVVDGLIKPDSGELRINSRVVDGPGPDRALVFQDFGLLPWRSVLGNIEFGLEAKGKPKAERVSLAKKYIELVGLLGFENHYPHELSGGMRQRVGIARALAADPDILLMDEPFASVDAQTREAMQSELLEIWGKDKKTVVFVTHSIEEAIYLSDKVILITARPGRVSNIIDIDIARPRGYETRTSGRFQELRLDIWNILGQEFKKSKQVASS